MARDHLRHHRGLVTVHQKIKCIPKDFSKGSNGSDGVNVELEAKSAIVAEFRQKALVRASVPQLWAAYIKVVDSEALTLLQSEDVAVLFQALDQHHQPEQSTKMMLQVALDVDDIGKQLPQDAYDMLIRQLVEQLPADRMKTVLWQIQGRRRFITRLVQLCNSNAEIRQVLGLYNRLVKESFDVDGFSTYYQSRKQLADNIGRIVARWVHDEGQQVNTAIVEHLLVFLLDRGVLDKVFIAISEMAAKQVSFSPSFYTTAIHRFGRSERFEYMDTTLDIMKGQGIEPSSDTYSAIIDAHSKAGNLKEAQMIYQSVLSMGLTPTDTTLGPLLEAVGKMGDYQMTRQLVDQMNASGISSNEYTFSSLLQSLSNDPDASIELFDELSKQMEPNTVNHNILIRTFQRHSDLDGAFRVFRSMVTNGTQPDRYTFSCILSLFATRGDVDGAEAFWNEMVDVHKVIPNIQAYGSMMHVYCTAEDMVSAQTVYRKMIGAGIMPNEIIFGTLLNAYARRGDLTQMLSIYDAMRAEGLRPNSYIYSNLLFGLIRDGDMVAAQRMYENMQEDGYGYNVLAQTILIKGYLDQGNFRKSQELYKNMLRLGLLPNYMTYATFLHAHAKRGEIREGRAFLDKIVTSRGLVDDVEKDETPDMRQGHDRETTLPEGADQASSSVSQEGHLSYLGTERKPLKIPSRPSLLLAYTPLLNAYAKESNIFATQELFQEIKDRGLQPNTITYTIMMDAYKRAGDVESVMNIWNELSSLYLGQLKHIISHPDKYRPSKGGVVEWVQDRLSTKGSKIQRLMQRPLSITLDTLCYSGRVHDAKTIWNEFEQIGFNFDSSNWNDYCIALARNGLLLDAFHIVQEKLLPGFESEQQLTHSARDKTSRHESSKPNTPEEAASPHPRQYSTLLYPRPRTFAALADGLEDLLSPKSDSRVQYRDHLSDPILMELEGAAPNTKRLEKQKRLIEAKLQPYPHPFKDLDDIHRQILWSIIRTEYPQVLEALNEGILTTTGPSDNQTTTSENGEKDRVSHLGKVAESDEGTAAAQKPAFKGFRVWRRLKWVMKDLERKKFLEESGPFKPERDLDLQRRRKPA
ncbi:hypothetical protein BGX31_011546 [Mortierella sp. GBA43]|nr:hypothetical protein BGX31_011546 [Mortierella sp. GBA43]